MQHDILALVARLALETLLAVAQRSEEHTSELHSLTNLVCRLLLEKKKKALYRVAAGGTHQTHRERPPCAVGAATRPITAPRPPRHARSPWPDTLTTPYRPTIGTSR